MIELKQLMLPLALIQKKDLVSPGHVFPLVSRNGDFRESSHTEASVDISILSKLNPSSVIWR